jgi:MFS family permease
MAIAPTAQDLTSANQNTHPTDSSLPWPSEKAGFYALFCIIFATFLNFFDLAIFGMLAERMKRSFEISDAMLGFVQGPASVIAYVIVGIPLARLVDIFPRKYVLSGGIAIIGTITALGGLAQSFGQFVGSRLFVGASGAANGPGSYSLLVDYFRPLRIPLVFALLQLGFILGQSIGTWGGGHLLAWTDTWAPQTSFMGLTVFSWQWIMVMAGLPGLLAAVLFLFVKEPVRRNPPAVEAVSSDKMSLGRKIALIIGWDAAREIWRRKTVFLPLFVALALSAVESQGLPPWRVPFIARTYGWKEVEISNLLGPLMLVAMLAGIAAGGVFISWMGKRYKDANIRATAIIFACTTVVTVACPLMPTAELAIGCMVLGVFFGLAGAPAQNAAIQRIVPNHMRGQVTALYLFMFTFFGAMGSFVIGGVSTVIVGDDQQIWKALFITALIFLPTATFFMWRGIKPYREEVERLEAGAAA